MSNTSPNLYDRRFRLKETQSGLIKKKTKLESLLKEVPAHKATAEVKAQRLNMIRDQLAVLTDTLQDVNMALNNTILKIEDMEFSKEIKEVETTIQEAQKEISPAPQTTDLLPNIYIEL